MNDNHLSSVLIVLTAVVAFVIIVRVVGRIISWRITLTVLAVAVLVVLGLLDIDPILTEAGHLLSNLFGSPHDQ